MGIRFTSHILGDRECNGCKDITTSCKHCEIGVIHRDAITIRETGVIVLQFCDNCLWYELMVYTTKDTRKRRIRGTLYTRRGNK